MASSEPQDRLGTREVGTHLRGVALPACGRCASPTIYGWIFTQYIVEVNIRLCILIIMKYDNTVALLGSEGVFDLATAVQLLNEKRETVRVQLSRWCKAGKLLSLRRGLYAFPEHNCGRKVNPAELANRLLTPSYLSRHWALGFFGLIPESVTTYTSVTSRTPCRFNNMFGAFRYQHVKRQAFFGYRPYKIEGRTVLMAEPEKALLDLWHLEKGAWTAARMEAMRFQNVELVDAQKLRDYAERYASSRLTVAALVWSMTLGETDGVEL